MRNHLTCKLRGIHRNIVVANFEINYKMGNKLNIKLGGVSGGK